MTDWWSAGIKAQRDWLAASRTSLDAGQAMVAWQEASHRAMNANMAAWKAWFVWWGGGR